MGKAVALALVTLLFAPAGLLFGACVLLGPAAQAHCLPTTPPNTSNTSTTSTIDGVSTVDAMMPIEFPVAPETARVVVPLPAGSWVRTSGFGMRVHPVTGIYRLHTGLDLAAPTGTPILAAADGRVTFAGPASGYGHLILITHTINGTPVATGYAHMPPGGIHVRAGETVTAGQHIGDVGADGYATGPHLHFEVRPGTTSSARVDPEPWLTTNGATDIATGPAAAHSVCNTGAPATSYSGQTPARLVPDPTSNGRITERTAHVLTQLQATFPDSRWSCWSPRPGQKSEHPLGRACDGTFGNSIGTAAAGPALELGWRVTTWLKDNAQILGIDYLIWQGRIWSTARASEGWRPYNGGGMHDPDDVTGGHYDHLHVTLTA